MIQRLLMIIIILAVLLGGGYYAYQELVPPPEETQAKGPVYATQPVQRGDISVGVEVSGPLNPSKGGGIQVPYFSNPSSGPMNFTIDQNFIEEGDQVVQGQVLAVLTAPDLFTQIDALEVEVEASRESLAKLMSVPLDQVDQIDPSMGLTLKAPIDGRVLDLKLEEGQELNQGQIVARIVNDSSFRLTAKLTPGELQEIHQGDAAVLRFADFSSQIKAHVTKVNPNPVPEPTSKLHDAQMGGFGSGNEDQYQLVYWVELEAENPGLVRPGMLAQVGLLKPEAASENAADMALDARWLRYYAEVKGYVDEQKVLSNADAIVTQIHVQEVESVAQGDPLITLAGQDTREMLEEKLDKIRQDEMKLRQLRSQMGQLEIRSPMDGVVAYTEIQPGQTVQAGQYLGNIFNTSSMRMWVNVDDVDIPLIQQNSIVKVTVPALPGKTLTGKVEHISTMGTDQNGIPQFSVDIDVQGIPELRPGMQAQGYIDAGSATGVLLVPLEAIFEEDGQPRVEVLQADGTTKIIAVELGLMNDRVAEVKSGLEEGQQVITGSSADLLPSQHIGSQDTLLPGQNSANQNGAGENTGGSPERSTESKQGR